MTTEIRGESAFEPLGTDSVFAAESAMGFNRRALLISLWRLGNASSDPVGHPPENASALGWRRRGQGCRRAGQNVVKIELMVGVLFHNEPQSAPALNRVVRRDPCLLQSVRDVCEVGVGPGRGGREELHRRFAAH